MHVPHVPSNCTNTQRPRSTGHGASSRFSRLRRGRLISTSATLFQRHFFRHNIHRQTTPHVTHDTTASLHKRRQPQPTTHNNGSNAQRRLRRQRRNDDTTTTQRRRTTTTNETKSETANGSLRRLSAVDHRLAHSLTHSLAHSLPHLNTHRLRVHLFSHQSHVIPDSRYKCHRVTPTPILSLNDNSLTTPHRPNNVR